MSNDVALCCFIEKINQDNVNDFLFKIEGRNYFSTQECEPFQESEYKKISYLCQFVDWLKMQPILALKTGSWHEITEIWKVKKDEKDTMVLVWSKETSWINIGELESL